jgi:lysozyme
MNETLSLSFDDTALTRQWERLVLFAYCDPASPMALAIQKMGLWEKYLAGQVGIPPLARAAKPAPGKKTNGDPWTIGYGHTGADVYENLRWTTDQANSQLMHDLQPVGDMIKRVVTREITKEQFIALNTLGHNIGIHALETSTLIRVLNLGDDMAAADQFRVWNKASGQVNQGLVNRREAERALFLLGATFNA